MIYLRAFVFYTDIWAQKLIIFFIISKTNFLDLLFGLAITIDLLQMFEKENNITDFIL